MRKNFDDINLEEIYRTAVSCVEKAAEIVLDARLRHSFTVNMKGPRDLVTSADLAAEKAILDEINRNFPDHAIFSEEYFKTTPDKETLMGPLWIIDPIDGTTNFAKGNLQVGISVAFALHGTVEVGVVKAPFLNESFSAIRGNGAKLNGERISTSDTSELEAALIATGFPYERDQVPLLVERVRRVLLNCRDIRRLGSAALDLCWVACGRFDGYYESVMPWDMAAGALIVREAGGRVGNIRTSYTSGSPTILPKAPHLPKAPILPKATLPEDLQCQNLLAAPKALYDKLADLLAV